MTTGEWHPATEVENYHIEPALLERFIKLSENDELSKLNEALTAQEQQQHGLLMSLSQKQWNSAAEAFSAEQITHLIRFFTLAEELPGWEAGEKSPVIWLNKALRKRGEKLSIEQLKWIKANTRNHFLPNGPALL